MQKLNVETEVYNSNKNVTEEKKKKGGGSKASLYFILPNEIGNYNVGGGGEEQKTNKQTKNRKESTEQAKT